MAACRAAERGRRTLLLEKKKRPGAKILMSGGSRCNVTHALDARGFVDAFGDQGPFLHSALAALTPEQLLDLIHAEGVATKVEPGGKIFPVSDRAEDVLKALTARLRRSGCTLETDEPVQSITPHAGGLRIVTSRRTLAAEGVVVTTGGQSYPSSGSTGDGYRWAAEVGHTIVPPRPALVPITSDAPWLRGLQGITLPDVEVAVCELGDAAQSTRPIARRRGSLLFTHFGVSGPAALDVSRWISGHAEPRRLVLHCDLAPDRHAESLESEFREACRQAGRRGGERSCPLRAATACRNRRQPRGDRCSAARRRSRANRFSGWLPRSSSSPSPSRERLVLIARRLLPEAWP